DAVTKQSSLVVKAGDFNRDGVLDLLSIGTNKTGSVGRGYTLRLGLGNGMFGASSFDTVLTQATDLEVADFNRDGILDWAVSGYGDVYPQTVAVALGNGSGGFGPQIRFGSGVSYLAITSGDVNRDGKLDLVCLHNPMNAGEAHVFLGNGDGTFQAPIVSTLI